MFLDQQPVGVFACPKSLTEDGLEMQIGVNHFGHFLFTCLLLPRIISSAPARIINLSSVAHLGAKLDFEDMNCEKYYNSVTAYARSKLANILFTKELAIRLKGTGVTTYAVHPGIIDTNISRHLNISFFRGARWLFKYFTSKTEEQGSQTTLHCALDEEVSNESGHYYRCELFHTHTLSNTRNTKNTDNCRKASSSLRSKDPELASRMWQESVRIVGLGERDPVCVKDQDPASTR
uniref:Retinol dehydrogenase 13 n=1 Tax=Timema monikensis TaxID=170555 RepID=A0A7R9HU89_9NEOP|nr:unnamed protein product [Timema monikensis]